MARDAAAAVGALSGGWVLAAFRSEAMFFGGAVGGIPVIFLLIVLPSAGRVENPGIG